VFLNCGIVDANSYFFDAFAGRSSKTAAVVHDVVQLVTSLSDEQRRQFEGVRAKLVERSDLVIGLSTGSISDIPGAHYVGHGCDDIWGTVGVDDIPEPADLRAIPHPRAVYLGALWIRICVEGFGALAESGVHVVLVGDQPSEQVQQLIDTNPRVHFLGSRLSADTAPYLLHSDVGIVPHSDEPFTRSMEPHKLYNYACAGLRSVALNCVVPERLEPWVTNTATVADFVEATRASAGERLDREDIETARSFTWSRVVSEIMDLVAQS
jgi:hypothetical protein